MRRRIARIAQALGIGARRRARAACRCRSASSPASRHARGPAMISSENGLLLATVLLNVQDRDVGGFVEEARTAVARAVTLPAGYYVEWSGRWENQARARQRLQLVLPIVLVVIFVLLYFTYGSLVEAAHVLLAVPFALTGGIYLLWAARLQLLGRGLGRLHRAVRHGRPDGRGDGHLPRGGGRAKASGARRPADAREPSRCRGGGGAAAAAAEGDDGLDGRRRPAADHVEHQRRRRGDEAAGRARFWAAWCRRSSTSWS